MLKLLGIIVVVNAVLIWLFVSANYFIGNELNSYPNELRYIRWSLFLIQDSHAASGAIVQIPNYPFWLFFASTAINLFFIIISLRIKKQNGILLRMPSP